MLSQTQSHDLLQCVTCLFMVLVRSLDFSGQGVFSFFIHVIFLLYASLRNSQCVTVFHAVHASIHPFTNLSLGHRDSSWRDSQIFLSPPAFLGVYQGTTRPAERWNLSRVSYICPGASVWLDMHDILPQGRVRCMSKRCSEGILTTRPNQLNWLFSMWRGSDSTLSFSQIVELLPDPVPLLPDQTIA